MNDMIAIKASKLPAHLQTRTKAQNVFAAAVSAGGFPVVSIKGKVFHVQRGDERTLVTKPGADDEPAASLEVVILATNPNKSKVYYAHGYEEGSSAKPDCYSNDGLSPASDAEDPQAKKCATCPHNQWGSRITDNGSKGKACSDSMRLAIAPAGQLNDPMLLRVPAASLKTLGAYGAQLAKRGVSPEHVVTKIGFDYTVAHPALTFKATRFVDEAELAEVEAVVLDEAETIGNITGTSGAPAAENEKLAETPAPRVTRSKTLEEAEEEAEVAPKKAKVRVEGDDDDGVGTDKAEPPAKSASKGSPVADYDDIDAALDNLDFDD
jgi:hypothetical protein